MGTVIHHEYDWPEPWGCGSNSLALDVSSYGTHYLVPVGGWESGFEGTSLRLDFTLTEEQYVFFGLIGTADSGAGGGATFGAGSHTVQFALDPEIYGEIVRLEISLTGVDVLTVDCIQFTDDCVQGALTTLDTLAPGEHEYLTGSTYAESVTLNDLNASPIANEDLSCVVDTTGRFAYCKSHGAPFGESWPDDPFLDYVVAELNMNGANNSTTFTDNYGHTFTRADATSYISTAQSKWGGASMYCGAGATAYIQSNDSADWEFGSGPFTIEAWVRAAFASGDELRIVGKRDATTNLSYYVLVRDTFVGVGLSSDGTTWAFNNTFALSMASNTWTHIAVCRDDSGDVRVFKNGTQVGSTLSGAVACFNGSATLKIGNHGSSSSDAGYIDDVRITKAARYTADFTPPDHEFDGTANTEYTYLAHADLEDAPEQTAIWQTTQPTGPFVCQAPDGACTQFWAHHVGQSEVDP